MNKASKFSDIPHIQEVVARGWEHVARAGITISLKQQIPYGAQFKLEGQGPNGLINIYYSKRKGLSFVDCSNNATSRSAIAILRGETTTAEPVDTREAKLTSWIGTDESGKGDFFGPLCVAGFFMTREMEKDLKCLGIMDSKKLSPANIKSIATTIRKDFRDHIAVVAPHNGRYNELYYSFKNLNKLLAWGHARVIEEIADRISAKTGEAVEGVVADKFGDERHIKNALCTHKDIQLIQRHKGESNLAVAAASIVARYTFESRLAGLRETFEINFPLGAGPHTIKPAREFLKKYGRERLGEVAKLHFKTCNEI